MDISTGRIPRSSSHTLEGGPSPASRLGDDFAGERFRGAMDDPVPVQEAPTAAKPEAAPAPGSTLGDAILSGVNRLSADFQHSWAQKEAGLSSDMNSWSAAQLVQFQAHVQTAGAVMDLMGKGVSKVVQGIEQVTKTQ